MRAYPHSMQHDGLALSAALELPFVDFMRQRVTLSADGQLLAAEHGVELRLSCAARYEAFMRWLDAALHS